MRCDRWRKFPQQLFSVKRRTTSIIPKPEINVDKNIAVAQHDTYENSQGHRQLTADTSRCPLACVPHTKFPTSPPHHAWTLPPYHGGTFWFVVSSPTPTTFPCPSGVARSRSVSSSFTASFLLLLPLGPRRQPLPKFAAFVIAEAAGI